MTVTYYTRTKELKSEESTQKIFEIEDLHSPVDTGHKASNAATGAFQVEIDFVKFGCSG